MQLFDGKDNLWGGRVLPQKLVLRAYNKDLMPDPNHYTRVRTVEGLWDCLRPCWEFVPSKRQTAEELCEGLRRLHV